MCNPVILSIFCKVWMFVQLNNVPAIWHLQTECICPLQNVNMCVQSRDKVLIYYTELLKYYTGLQTKPDIITNWASWELKLAWYILHRADLYDTRFQTVASIYITSPGNWVSYTQDHLKFHDHVSPNTRKHVNPKVETQKTCYHLQLTSCPMVMWGLYN